LSAFNNDSAAVGFAKAIPNKFAHKIDNFAAIRFVKDRVLRLGKIRKRFRWKRADEELVLRSRLTTQSFRRRSSTSELNRAGVGDQAFRCVVKI